MDSLSSNPLLDEGDLMQRFVSWWEDGEYLVTGCCFDIGMTTRQALARRKQTGNPIAGCTDPGTAGNRSLRGLAPVSIRHWHDRERLPDVAARQIRTTHGAPEAVDACVAYAGVSGDAIAGKPRSNVMQARAGDYTGAIATIMAGSWRGKHRKEIRSSGYVTHSLGAALWCVGRTARSEEAVLLAANLAEDADATTAISGQLAGALCGASGIPECWRKKLAWEERITRMAFRMFDAGVAAVELVRRRQETDCDGRFVSPQAKLGRARRALGARWWGGRRHLASLIGDKTPAWRAPTVAAAR